MDGNESKLRRRPRILFVGAGNRCRTQMAEGYIHALGSDCFEARSAGVQSDRVDRRAVRVMEEDGVDIKNCMSKLVSAELLTWADLVIVIAGTGEKVSPAVPNSAREKQWLVEAPAARAESSEDVIPYREARDQIKRRVTQLINATRLFKR
ncbi:MAG: arsenate reductase ArsC [Chromatiales bacterium]|jgi:protein-tyrosine-phosphatase